MGNDNKEVKSAIQGPSFHGENWYRCPHCKEEVEFYSFKRTGEKYIYECPRCHGKVRIV